MNSEWEAPNTLGEWLPSFDVSWPDVGQEVHCLGQREPRKPRRKWVGEAAKPQTSLTELIFLASRALGIS